MYRLSGDYNPLHADPLYAKNAGCVILRNFLSVMFRSNLRSPVMVQGFDAAEEGVSELKSEGETFKFSGH